MNLALRWIERIAILAIALLAIWLIVTQVFNRLDEQLSLFTALLCTYLVSAYFVLPRIVHASSLILRKGHIPRFTRAADGLPADPVNIIFVGSARQLHEAFAKAEWVKADRLGFRTGVRMITSFVANRPYPAAPFSSLFLFGRMQDVGFQKAIGKSPRKRHHVRFWAANTESLVDPLDIKYWTSKQAVDYSKPVMWLGAATKDTGFGLTKLTYQISHRTDPEVDAEREFVVESLTTANADTSRATFYESGQFKIGKYVSDGKIAAITAERP